MRDNFVRQSNAKEISVSKIVTILYLENYSDFVFEGEAHDFWEFAYIDKGAMVFTADNREFLLHSGEMVFHKPNEFHRLEARELSCPNITVVSFVCNSAAMKVFEHKIFKLSAEERGVLSRLLQEGQVAFSPLTARPPVYGMQRRESPPFGAIQRTFSLLEEFLIALIRRDNESIHRESRCLSPMVDESYPKEIKDIVEFMDNNLHQSFFVADIARAFHISEAKLKKLFEQYAQCGVIECFNGRKLLKAKQLIRENSLNFTQIAEALGFNSIHYFSRLFKEKTGQTPSEYKISIK